jgi:hypothetical protein
MLFVDTTARIIQQPVSVGKVKKGSKSALQAGPSVQSLRGAPRSKGKKKQPKNQAHIVPEAIPKGNVKSRNRKEYLEAIQNAVAEEEGVNATVIAPSDAHSLPTMPNTEQASKGTESDKAHFERETPLQHHMEKIGNIIGPKPVGGTVNTSHTIVPEVETHILVDMNVTGNHEAPKAVPKGNSMSRNKKEYLQAIQEEEGRNATAIKPSHDNPLPAMPYVEYIRNRTDAKDNQFDAEAPLPHKTEKGGNQTGDRPVNGKVHKNDSKMPEVETIFAEGMNTPGLVNASALMSEGATRVDQKGKIQHPKVDKKPAATKKKGKKKSTKTQSSLTTLELALGK